MAGDFQYFPRVQFDSIPHPPKKRAGKIIIIILFSKPSFNLNLKNELHILASVFRCWYSEIVTQAMYIMQLHNNSRVKTVCLLLAEIQFVPK